ncbi:MAG: dihydrolipoyl dehydrogenase [Egibacteraceae bacterium]
MPDTYEMVVLGGGTGGYSCALSAATLGMRVALVERAKVGGTCLHWGCIPTKAFLQAAEVAEHARTAGQYGVKASFDGVDVTKVLGYKDRIVDASWKGLQATLKARGVETVAGTGRLDDARTLVVATEEGERTLVASKALVLATGSTPRQLPVEGAEIDGQVIITSDEAMTLKRVPSRPIVLGASAVGVEFATVWHGWGAEEVTVIEALDALVPREDVDTSRALARAFKKSGVTVLVGDQVTKVEHGDDGVRAHTQRGQSFEGDLLMVAVGRRPVSEDMGFEGAGVSLDKNGYVVVDEFCRTGVAWDGGAQYAIGDVIPTLGLAHASFQEGFLVAEHAAGQRVRPIDYLGVPRVYYCHPEIGAVGYTEQELRDQGIAYESQTFPFSHSARAMMMRGSGHAKVLAAKDNGRVLGIHIIGPHATDLIAEGQLIYNWEALPTEVAEFIHPHPTLTEAIGEAHLALAGKPLHG